MTEAQNDHEHEDVVVPDDVIQGVPVAFNRRTRREVGIEVLRYLDRHGPETVDPEEKTGTEANREVAH